MKTLCFTGHRPNKLNGYNPKDNSELLWKIAEQVEIKINEGYSKFITGMALGVDMWSALIVIKLREKYPNIQLICAIPCKAHPCKWNKADQDLWGHIVSLADAVYLITDAEYTPQCMQVRNIWMCDQSNSVLAVWDGTKGGTRNCVEYAIAKSKPILQINPKTLAVTEIN